MKNQKLRDECSCDLLKQTSDFDYCLDFEKLKSCFNKDTCHKSYLKTCCWALCNCGNFNK